MLFQTPNCWVHYSNQTVFALVLEKRTKMALTLLLHSDDWASMSTPGQPFMLNISVNFKFVILIHLVLCLRFCNVYMAFHVKMCQYCSDSNENGSSDFSTSSQFHVFVFMIWDSFRFLYSNLIELNVLVLCFRIWFFMGMWLYLSVHCYLKIGMFHGICVQRCPQNPHKNVICFVVIFLSELIWSGRSGSSAESLFVINQRPKTMVNYLITASKNVMRFHCFNVNSNMSNFVFCFNSI